MSLAEVQQQALALTDHERARLVVSLLETLPPAAEISDEEVFQRDADLETGRVEEISEEQFQSSVLRDRLR